MLVANRMVAVEQELATLLPYSVVCKVSGHSPKSDSSDEKSTQQSMYDTWMYVCQPDVQLEHTR